MTKKFEVGDVIHLTGMAETYKFEVVRVTPTVAYAEERSLYDNSPVNPGCYEKFRREYEETELSIGWKTYEVFNKPLNQWWMQCGVIAKN